MTDQKFRMLLEINGYVQTLVSTKSKNRLLYCIKLNVISIRISSAEIADDCVAKFSSLVRARDLINLTKINYVKTY